MNRLSVIVLTALFLTACASSPAKDDSPASDLDALNSGIRQTLPDRHLSNGKDYCVEDARTEGERDDCALDLEDLVFMLKQDGKAAIDLVGKAVNRLKLQRTPCGFFARTFRVERCDPKNSTTRP
jgi:hypothetical protein